MNHKYEVQQMIGGEWLTMFVKTSALKAFELAEKLPGRTRVVISR